MFMNRSDIQQVTFAVSGMMCNGCEAHVSREVQKLDGIVSVTASHKMGNAVVEFDKTKTDVGNIEEAINSTGYTVTEKTVQ